MTEYWNHNVARHPDILRALPDGCPEVLDVGCGDGLLAQKLATRAKHVTAIDRSAEMIARARERNSGAENADFVAADFRTADLPAEGYDFICSVATIHHMDFVPALTRMGDLLRPGGVLMVVGLARNTTVGEWLFGGIGLVCTQTNRHLRPGFGGPAGLPATPPGMSWGEVRAEARRTLPSVAYRRHLLARYSLRWQKPG